MNIRVLLNGAAIAAALAIAGPVWAQSSSGGNGMGLPGPNPGGGGILTPYSGGGYPVPATAIAPAHHRLRHARGMHAHRTAIPQEAALTGDTTAQLNREELVRIHSYAPPAPAYTPPSALMSAAPVPPQASPSGGNSIGIPGPNPGGPGLTPYTD